MKDVSKIKNKLCPTPYTLHLTPSCPFGTRRCCLVGAREGEGARRGKKRQEGAQHGKVRGCKLTQHSTSAALQVGARGTKVFLV